MRYILPILLLSLAALASETPFSWSQSYVDESLTPDAESSIVDDASVEAVADSEVVVLMTPLGGAGIYTADWYVSATIEVGPIVLQMYSSPVEIRTKVGGMGAPQILTASVRGHKIAGVTDQSAPWLVEDLHDGVAELPFILSTGIVVPTSNATFEVLSTSTDLSVIVQPLD